MKSIVTHTSYIIDFMDIEFDTNKISLTIENEANEYLKSYKINNLDDWKLRFRTVYNNGKQLLISKNKFGTLITEKCKEITIVIPIPPTETVPWGVKQEQYVYKKDHYDEIKMNFNVLEICYADFNNRTDFIEYCLRKSIEYCFFNGITIKGTKIKFDN